MFKYKDVNINYERLGNKKGTPLILLHGWGQNIQMMKMIGEKYPKNDVVIIDFPGHGKSEEPKEIWTLDDFTNMVHELLESLNLKDNDRHLPLNLKLFEDLLFFLLCLSRKFSLILNDKMSKALDQRK